METLIGTLIGGVVGWFGNWWCSRGTRERHAEVLRELGLIRSAVTNRGFQLEEKRDAAGHLEGVDVVARAETVPLSATVLPATPHISVSPGTVGVQTSTSSVSPKIEPSQPE